mmetsp:Transcript_135330/g.234668  ORF Transcript_135330/g.234668 Transcript_135330/m.234668 type:complete len:233 (+) Transcript_135330:1824-2522(+)
MVGDLASVLRRRSGLPAPIASLRRSATEPRAWGLRRAEGEADVVIIDIPRSPPFASTDSKTSDEPRYRAEVFNDGLDCTLRREAFSLGLLLGCGDGEEALRLSGDAAPGPGRWSSPGGATGERGMRHADSVWKHSRRSCCRRSILASRLACHLINASTACCSAGLSFRGGPRSCLNSGAANWIIRLKFLLSSFCTPSWISIAVSANVMAEFTLRASRSAAAAAPEPSAPPAP